MGLEEDLPVSPLERVEEIHTQRVQAQGVAAGGIGPSRLGSNDAGFQGAQRYGC